MIKVTLLGTGKVAQHLFDAFLATETIEVVQVVGRNKAALRYFEKATSTTLDFTKIQNSDIYIIAISDDAIYTVSELFTEKKSLVVHTSGSMGIEALAPNKHCGVFYPLQTFSEGRKIDFQSVPICIEAKEKSDLPILKTLAGAISESVFEISSEQRKSLHLAAVFVNNFTNHLYALGAKICEENKLPFELLKPLIYETAQKMASLSPVEAQTGPAKRNDQQTIAGQLDQLKHKDEKEIYKILTDSIQKTYGEKL